MRRSAPLWVLRLVPAGPLGSMLYVGSALGVLLGGYTLAARFGAPSSDAAPFNVTVFFAVILAYIVPVYRYIVMRTSEAFAEIEPLLDATAEEIAAWRQTIGGAPPSEQVGYVLLGLVSGLFHTLAMTGEEGLANVFTASAADAAVIVGTFLVWVFMTSVIVALIHIARLFARLGRRVRVDLLQPRALTPFARVAVIMTLAVIGAQASFPILWVTSGLSAIATLPGLVATAVPMLFLFAMPLVPVHRAIAAAKRAELAHLDAKVAAVSRSEGEETARLARLAPLLAYRRAVEDVQEWPFDMSVSGRLGFYLVIPPFTWIAAALVERLVDAM